MKALRTRLQEARKDLGIPWEILERDYLLTWILAGIAQVAIPTPGDRRPSRFGPGCHGRGSRPRAS